MGSTKYHGGIFYDPAVGAIDCITRIHIECRRESREKAMDMRREEQGVSAYLDGTSSTVTKCYDIDTALSFAVAESR